MPERDLQWLVLEDFSAGIVQRTNAFVANAPAPSRSISAQVASTYGCIGLPGGGLGPLPGRHKTVSMGAVMSPAPVGGTGPVVVTGLGSLAPVRDTSIQPFLSPNFPTSDIAHPDVLYLFNAWYAPHPTPGFLQRQMSVSQIQAYGTSTGRGPYHVVPQFANFYTAGGPGVNQIPSGSLGGDQYPNVHSGVWTGTNNRFSAGATIPNAPAFWASVTGVTTFNNAESITISNSGSNVMGEGTFGFDGSATLGGLLLARDVAGNNVDGMMLHHQGRIVILSYEQIVFFQNPQILGANTNEYVSWSDPPGSFQFISGVSSQHLQQKALFYPEFWVGYGTGRSTNAGELFLVKHRGGGVLISGDLNNPSAFRLPSVVSTGGVCGPGAQSTIGFVYLTATGAYVWRGGDGSTKISPQLDDLFFNSTGALGRLVVSQVQAEEWNDYVMLTGGWLYDTNQQSWWRLDNPAQTNLQWFTRSYSADVMYAAEATWNISTDPILYTYDRQYPASFYSWQSNPIVVNNNRTVEIPEAVVYAQGTGTINVTIAGTAVTSGSNTASFAISSTTPVAIRKPIATQTSPVIVTITSTGTGSAPAPILYALHLGWRESPAKLNRF